MLAIGFAREFPTTVACFCDGQVSTPIPHFRQVPPSLPKAFLDLRFLLTRYENSNDLHRAMKVAFERVFEDRVCEHPVEMIRAVEQSGRSLSSIYEMDCRDMTRETCRLARATFDQAYEEFKGNVITCWDQMEDRS